MSFYSPIEIASEYGVASGYVVDSKAEQTRNYLTIHIDVADKIANWMEVHSERVAILKNINVFDHCRGRGYGNDLLKAFISEAGSVKANAIILISDNGESQENGFVLDTWYEKNDFCSVVNSISSINPEQQNTVMVWPANLGESLKSTLTTLPIIGIVLKDDSTAAIKMRIVPDVFYGDALAADDDGNGQSILELDVYVGGLAIAHAQAGYLAPSHGSHLSMLNIVVAPDWRRKGVASALYDAVEGQYGDSVLPYPGNEGGAIQHFWLHRLKDSPEVLDRVRYDIGNVSGSRASPRL